MYYTFLKIVIELIIEKISSRIESAMMDSSYENELLILTYD